MGILFALIGGLAFVLWYLDILFKSFVIALGLFALAPLLALLCGMYLVSYQEYAENGYGEDAEEEKEAQKR